MSRAANKMPTCVTGEELSEARRREAAFWARCEKMPSGCWEWAGSVSRGYGNSSLLGRNVRAHRIALMLSLGRPLAMDELACHRCDNRRCVKPDHLFTGSAQDNVNDRVSKGRGAHGERAGNAVVTEEVARAIIASKLPQRELAREFGIGQKAVLGIHLNKTWRHLPRPAISFVCDDCARDFYDRKGLANHMRRVREAIAEGKPQPHIPNRRPWTKRNRRQKLAAKKEGER